MFRRMPVNYIVNKSTDQLTWHNHRWATVSSLNSLQSSNFTAYRILCWASFSKSSNTQDTLYYSKLLREKDKTPFRFSFNLQCINQLNQVILMYLHKCSIWRFQIFCCKIPWICYIHDFGFFVIIALIYEIPLNWDKLGWNYLKNLQT